MSLNLQDVADFVHFDLCVTQHRYLRAIVRLARMGMNVIIVISMYIANVKTRNRKYYPGWKLGCYISESECR